MCVIVHQPAETEFEKETFDKLWKRNDDGGGFAFINGRNQVQTFKYMDPNEYWMNYRTWRGRYPETDFMLHLRITTHGKTDLTNVHPFKVDEHTVLAHNGIIGSVYDYQDGRSDTRVFIENVLSKLPTNWYLDDDLMLLVEEAIGTSRVMLLTSNPQSDESVIYLNRSRWEKHEGLVMSNTHGLETQFSYNYGEYWNNRWQPSGKGGSWINNNWVPHGDVDENKQKAKEVIPAELNDELAGAELDEAEIAMLEELRLDYWQVTGPLFQLMNGIVRCGDCWDAIDWIDAECSCTEKFEAELAKKEDELNETGKLLLYSGVSERHAYENEQKAKETVLVETARF